MTRKELMDKEAFRLYPTFVQDREIFRRGFEYADNNPNHEAFNIRLKLEKEEWLDKACEFIKDHHHEFSFWNTEEYELGFSTQKFIDDFKKYMEDK